MIIISVIIGYSQQEIGTFNLFTTGQNPFSLNTKVQNNTVF